MTRQATQNRRRWICTLVALSLTASLTVAEAADVPADGTLLGTFTNAPTADPQQPGSEPWRWWDEARLGIFFHFGPESLTTTSLRDVYHGVPYDATAKKQQKEQYGWPQWRAVFSDPANRKKVLETFNPEKFDARQIVANVRKIGGRYIVFTAIHHDGFANWDTAMHDFKSTKTRCGKNLCAELGAACKEAKMPLMWYVGTRGAFSGTPAEKLVDPQDPKRSVDTVFRDRVIDELLRTYPDTAGFWWDEGFDARQVSHAYYAAKYGRGDLIFVSNGRQQGAVRCFEKRTDGFNRSQRWEKCTTFLNFWFWEYPTPYPDDASVLRSFLNTLVEMAGNDGNSLIDLALAPEGSFEPNLQKAVDLCGSWMERYGAAIYGSRGGPRQRGIFYEQKPAYTRDNQRMEKFNSTCKGKMMYLFVWDWAKQDRIEMPALPAKIVTFKTLSGGNGLVENDEKSLRVTRPKEGENPKDIFTCFAIELDQEAFSIPPVFGLAVEQSPEKAKP